MASLAPPRELISDATTARLSVYLRCLNELHAERAQTVSSAELAERFHLNSAQIRKDLACFGEFGIRGVGYNVERLRAHMIRTLGLDRQRNIVIVGAGNLGMALADYSGFNSEGFHLLALMDNAPAKIGTRSRSGIPVLSVDALDDLVRTSGVDIGVIAVNPGSAQEVHDRLVNAGIQAVLNFAPVQIRQSAVKVKSVDLRVNLETLSYHLKVLESLG